MFVVSFVGKEESVKKGKYQIPVQKSSLIILVPMPIPSMQRGQKQNETTRWKNLRPEPNNQRVNDDFEEFRKANYEGLEASF